MQINLTLLPYLEPLLECHHKDPQQPDNLCGPYWVSLLLRAYGELTITAVEAAIAASTILPDRGNPSDWLPPSAQSLQGANYSQIPTHTNLQICGTSITGLIHATTTLSQSRFCLIPLQIPDWQQGLATLWQLCQAHPGWQAIPLLNLHTRYLWGTTPSPLSLISYLQSKQPSPPPTDWNVGHFNLLIGAAQQDSQSLYTLLDTYPHFGWQGIHLQPPGALSQSLHRPQHPTQGGLALFTSKQNRTEIEHIVSENGFKISVWDNGSPMQAVSRTTPEPLPGGESD